MILVYGLWYLYIYVYVYVCIYIVIYSGGTFLQSLYILHNYIHISG